MLWPPSTAYAAIVLLHRTGAMDDLSTLIVASGLEAASGQESRCLMWRQTREIKPSCSVILVVDVNMDMTFCHCGRALGQTYADNTAHISLSLAVVAH